MGIVSKSARSKSGKVSVEELSQEEVSKFEAFFSGRGVSSPV